MLRYSLFTGLYCDALVDTAAALVALRMEVLANRDRVNLINVCLLLGVVPHKLVLSCLS